ncbi:hypothetical protein CRV24_000332 [Beauveria bassiana]|nr:hypothetical protein CRV24_000332 [Beauveria bassiana]
MLFRLRHSSSPSVKQLELTKLNATYCGLTCHAQRLHIASASGTFISPSTCGSSGGKPLSIASSVAWDEASKLCCLPRSSASAPVRAMCSCMCRYSLCVHPAASATAVCMSFHAAVSMLSISCSTSLSKSSLNRLGGEELGLSVVIAMSNRYSPLTVSA